MSSKFVPLHLRGPKTNSRNNLRPIPSTFILRKKVIIVPRFGNKVVVVRNKGSQQLTFPGGGCNSRENSRTCAAKELREETRGVINKKGSNLELLFSFPSRNRVPNHLLNNLRKGQVVTQVYDVYSVTVNKKPSRTNFMNGTFLLDREKTHKNFTETNNIRRISVANLKKFNPGVYGIVVNNVLPKLH